MIYALIFIGVWVGFYFFSKSNKQSDVVALGGGFVIALMAVTISDIFIVDDSKIKAKESVQKAALESRAKLPPTEIAFINTVEQMKSKYESAPNELKKSAIRTERAKLIATALNNSKKVDGWIGVISKMETNHDGNAILSVKLESSEIELKTWNNALSDLSDNTLIAQASPLYNTIAEMKVGQQVNFYGKFFAGDRDFIKESSVREGGSMTEPEFIFNFSKVRLNDSDSKPTVPATSRATDIKNQVKKQAIINSPISNETVSQKSAVKKAKTYLSHTAFSHDGLVAQLEYEQFSHTDAVYGADNSGANWKEQAAKKAKQYMKQSAFSRGSLIDQLTYENFTQEQAEYGVNAVGL